LAQAWGAESNAEAGPAGEVLGIGLEGAAGIGLETEGGEAVGIGTEGRVQVALGVPGAERVTDIELGVDTAHYGLVLGGLKGVIGRWRGDSHWVEGGEVPVCIEVVLGDVAEDIVQPEAVPEGIVRMGKAEAVLGIVQVGAVPDIVLALGIAHWHCQDQRDIGSSFPIWMTLEG